MKKNSPTKLSLNPLSLFAETVLVLKNNLSKILIISAIVAIPGAILRVTSFDNGVTDFSIVASLAGLYASLALLFVFNNPTNLKHTSWTQTYIASSGRFLPFIGVTIIQGLVGLFVVLGGLLPVIYLAGVVALPFGLVGAILCLIAVWLLVRLSIAGIIVASTDLSVISSVRASWLGTKKRFWVLLLDWFLIFTLVVIGSGIFLRIAYIVPAIGENMIALALVNGVLVTIFLPIVLGFGVGIWKRIQAA